MKNKIKDTVISLASPLIFDAIRRFRGTKISFVGNFRSWEEAKIASTGYSAQVILDRTVQAARKVRDGEAAYERDSVIFARTDYNFPLAWALMRAAARHGGLHVLDFGGALGSSYFQSRELINSISNLKWIIVEQSAHVEVGSREFANGVLSFHRTIEEACNLYQIDVLLLSGVIQCLQDPFGFLDDVLSRRIPSVILDRTPFMLDGAKRLTVQHVPKRIYPATYPAWFFSEDELMQRFVKHYDKIATWPALDRHHPEGGRAEYKGFLFEVKIPS